MEHPDLTLAFTLTIRAPQCGLFGEHIAEKAARLLFCFFPFLVGLHVLMAERQMLWLGVYIYTIFNKNNKNKNNEQNNNIINNTNSNEK